MIQYKREINFSKANVSPEGNKWLKRGNSGKSVKCLWTSKGNKYNILLMVK